ncbi:hypothetical protein EWM62_04515 [Mucilaginibacter terrigena]|uniref:DinB-like domain-containing protein n=1 Tax=Mucilaginibacter terrigena TaxID=2492395 RepID=A0A4Q5LP97_9SPHI|nr:DinB family protein [Mucilaginibacter terrigena]RYU91207.1 hypothetical protein EWM62_04515 [Mucilaginibacter terrigena]
MPNQFQTLFAGSFDTFKVFDNLTLNDINTAPANAPKTIWQILNHLIKWQGYQLAQIKNIDKAIILNEEETWINEQQPATQDELDKALAVFKGQQQILAMELSLFDEKAPGISQKLKIVQDLSIHLSFHVGEVVLMRRMAGTYPLPHQMRDFLS